MVDDEIMRPARTAGHPLHGVEFFHAGRPDQLADFESPTNVLGNVLTFEQGVDGVGVERRTVNAPPPDPAEEFRNFGRLAHYPTGQCVQFGIVFDEGLVKNLYPGANCRHVECHPPDVALLGA